MSINRLAASQDKKYILALDAMGGDNAPYCVIAGAALFAKEYKHVDFLLFGDKDIIEPIYAKFPILASRAVIEHTKDFIKPEEKPSIALRKGKKSSMRLAIEAVKTGQADAIISAGNTGALLRLGYVPDDQGDLFPDCPRHGQFLSERCRIERAVI